MTAYDIAFRRLLTRIDAERAHRLGFAAIRAAQPLLSGGSWLAELGPAAPRVGARGRVEAMGLTFPHPLGLAAGFDKNALGVDALAALGFGHVEVGTVTARPQPGNPKPRLFRLPDDQAIVNRMGFNNDGAEVVARRLAARATARRGKPAVVAAGSHHGPGSFLAGPVLGVNIGKSKVVPEDDQAAVEDDYGTSARLLAPYADYLVVNVSSPNTRGLRSLQAVDRLAPLLEAVRGAAGPVPLLVKIAPDLADAQVLEVVDLAKALGLDGLIATNTTVARGGLASDPAEVERIGPGGLSGRPLADRSLQVLRLARDRVGDSLTLVSAGGIATVADARARLQAGATLLQAYTGFVYGGPMWPRRIARGLARD